MSEYEMDWANGFYDEFHQALYDGEVTIEEAHKLYKEKRITPYQYMFAVDYLEMKD